MGMKRFNISLPLDLLEPLDAAAKAEYVSRSTYIREAIELRLRVDKYVANEVTDRESYFGVLKAAHFGRFIKRDINRYKPNGQD
jgi:metal-responsive CopG/Arc/MetJ family transcriptional regulator